MLYSEQKGTTMMEALAAISVVTVLTVGVIKLIGNMFDMFKQNMITTEIQEVQKKIAERYRLEGVYTELSSLTPQQMKDEQLVPSQMLVNDKLVHRQNGEVEIKTSTLGDEYYDVTFKSLSNRSCVNLSQINWDAGQTSDLFRIQINDKVFKSPVDGVNFGDDNALPITVKKAADSCESGSDNQITWTFQ